MFIIWVYVCCNFIYRQMLLLILLINIVITSRIQTKYIDKMNCAIFKQSFCFVVLCRPTNAFCVNILYNFQNWKQMFVSLHLMSNCRGLDLPLPMVLVAWQLYVPVLSLVRCWSTKLWLPIMIPSPTFYLNSAPCEKDINLYLKSIKCLNYGI